VHLLHDLFDRGERFQEVVCRVNPSLGREREYALTAAPTRKTVMVVGGGPAGLEAARVAAERGDRVVLTGQERKLGGSLAVASLVKGGHREDLTALSRYLGVQARKAGVEVHTGTAATASDARNLQPDVLLLAAGGRHEVPDIPGIDRRKASPESSCTTWSSWPSRPAHRPAAPSGRALAAPGRQGRRG
jgi:2,4-dienoyl-CoA reductase (NADPH2)